MYDYGQGVTQDYQQAIVWYRKAAKQGYTLAQKNLDNLHNSGLDNATNSPQPVTQAQSSPTPYILSLSEQQSLEMACTSASLQGPAALDRCVQNQLNQLSRVKGGPVTQNQGYLLKIPEVSYPR